MAFATLNVLSNAVRMDLPFYAKRQRVPYSDCCRIGERRPLATPIRMRIGWAFPTALTGD
jgi:hypothetical protein